MGRAVAIGLCCLAALQPMLSGCDGHKEMAPRSPIGDGHQLLQPVAPGETVTIGYPRDRLTAQSNAVTIHPDGTITFETFDASRQWRTVSTKRISAAAMKRLRARLATFRPPARQPGTADETVWFRPVGCHEVNDGGEYAGLVFEQRGQAARWLSIPQSGCETSIAERLLLRLQSIVNNEPNNARVVGLPLSN